RVLVLWMPEDDKVDRRLPGERMAGGGLALQLHRAWGVLRQPRAIGRGLGVGRWAFPHRAAKAARGFERAARHLSELLEQSAPFSSPLRHPATNGFCGPRGENVRGTGPSRAEENDGQRRSGGP